MLPIQTCVIARRVAVACALLTAPIVGCRQEAPAATPPVAHALDPCAAALATPAGEDAWSRTVRDLQSRVREARDAGPILERLGWTFVAGARVQQDESLYQAAELCAQCLDRRQPGSAAALLLRGHVLDSRHAFREAEAVARRLVAMREFPADFGLLGDALLEQGRLGEAAAAYQRMLDLRPGLESYARAAQVRWLAGQVQGARELMEMAVRAGSRREPEPLAWASTRLAQYALQLGEGEAALQLVDAALTLVDGYPPALLARGRLRLAQGRAAEAIKPLGQSLAAQFLPETAWALADALQQAGLAAQAAGIEGQLAQRGAFTDPRSYALYLATRGRQLDTALTLAKAELGVRQDVFTWDAVAWTLHAAGRHAEALEAMAHALAEGTDDARLSLHAALVFDSSGRSAEARRHRERARALQALLLPSERALLDRAEASAR